MSERGKSVRGRGERNKNTHITTKYVPVDVVSEHGGGREY